MTKYCSNHIIIYMYVQHIPCELVKKNNLKHVWAMSNICKQKQASFFSLLWLDYW